jgi:hypothetical protein
MWGIILHHGTACVKPGIVSPPAAEGGKRGIVSPPAAESVKRGIVSPPAAEGGGRRCDPFLLAAKTTSRVGTAARVNNRRPVKSHRVHPSSRRQEGIASRYGGYRRRIEKRSPRSAAASRNDPRDLRRPRQTIPARPVPTAPRRPVRPSSRHPDR